MASERATESEIEAAFADDPALVSFVDSASGSPAAT